MSKALNVVPKAQTVKTGVKNAKGVADGVIEALADTYRLVFKTHACHWNAEGPLFYSVHHLTEGQYENLFAAADVLAERARALGRLAPNSLADIIEMSQIKDFAKTAATQDMVEALASDHEAVAKRMHDLIEKAEDAKDPVTADLLTARSAFHEKAAWMLRATTK